MPFGAHACTNALPRTPPLPVPFHADKTDGGPKAEASWGEVLASRGARVGVALFVLQQFSGINAIVYFSSAVFEVGGRAGGRGGRGVCW